MSVVDHLMVMGAQQHQVGQVRRSAVPPPPDVMGVQEPGVPAAGGAAAFPVDRADLLAQGDADVALPATKIEPGQRQ